MAAGPKLDGAGTVKLATLDDASLRLQSLHALVERMGVEVKAGKPIGSMAQQLKRNATPLQGQLKAQFGLISDLVTSLLLIAGRGGPDAIRLRAFREHVAQIRAQLEIAIAQTKEKHKVREKEHE
jgi:hypothetical protein